MDSSSISTMKEGLPEDVLVEIFLRLPPKSIYKFKCLSKVWYSRLSDPNFMHNKFKTLKIKPWAIFSNNPISKRHLPPHVRSKLMHTQFASSCSEISGYEGFSFSFLIESYGISAEYHKLYVLASDNGLVLCSPVHYCTEGWTGRIRYFVCNPITKQSVSLPPPPTNGFGEFSHGLITDTYSSSATACESTFTVVRTRTTTIWLWSTSGFEVEIYFSNLDEWRTYYVAYIQPWQDAGTIISKVSNVITHNGVVYWLQDCNRIVAYDLKVNNYECDSHQCNTLNVPGVKEHESPSSECLGVSAGFVCYGHIQKNTLRTWVLIKDDDSIENSVWDSKYEIELTDFSSTEVSLMAFSPMDHDVVILGCGMQIFPRNFTKGTSESVNRLWVPPGKNSFKTQHGYSPIIVTPTLTTMSKARS